MGKCSCLLVFLFLLVFYYAESAIGSTATPMWLQDGDNLLGTQRVVKSITWDVPSVS